MQPSAVSLRSIEVSARDVSGQTVMKGAAKCDNYCELQTSGNHQTPECTLHMRDTPERALASNVVLKKN